MLHRIRKAMRTETFIKMGGEGRGPVEVDETIVGGKPKNMHLARRKKMQRAVDGRSGKVIVMGMLDRESRSVRAKAVPDVKHEILQAEILDQIQKDSEPDRQGGRNAGLICRFGRKDRSAGGGSLRRSHFSCSSLFPFVQLGFYFGVRHGYEPLHKFGEALEVTRLILGGLVRLTRQYYPQK